MAGCRLAPGLALLALLLALAGHGAALQNVTAQLFGAEAYGTPAAFGDFNSDKQTDLFVLRGGKRGAGPGAGWRGAVPGEGLCAPTAGRAARAPGAGLRLTAAVCARVVTGAVLEGERRVGNASPG